MAISRSQTWWLLELLMSKDYVIKEFHYKNERGYLYLKFWDLGGNRFHRRINQEGKFVELEWEDGCV